MIEVYVLNGDLEEIDVIDSFKSLIWAKRYNTDGDCELYVEANEKNLNSLRKGNYLTRTDDDMICRIKKVELDTDVENGNYIIVTASDVKDVLGQRIIWGQTNVNGNVEDYIRNIVTNNLINPTIPSRQIPNFLLGDKAGFKEVTTEQISYKNIKEKVQELCKKYNWGYKVILEIKKLYFSLYKGTDRSETVIFSSEFENLKATKYVEDSTNLANVALVGGEGEGSERSKDVSGEAEGVNRYEIFVDAKDVSRTIASKDLLELYPNAYVEGSTYKINSIDILIVDDKQLNELQTNYTNGKIVSKDGTNYYQVSNVVIADKSNDDNVILRDLIYSVYLLSKGYEKLAEYGTSKSFEGTVEPETTFKYKEDYFLGDEVTVENEYGISTKARIVEVVEVFDENGHSVEPKFEYVEVN